MCIDQQVLYGVLISNFWVPWRCHSTLRPPHWWSVCGALRCPYSGNHLLVIQIWKKTSSACSIKVGFISFPILLGFSPRHPSIVTSTELLRYLHWRGQSVAIFDTSRLGVVWLSHTLRQPSSPPEKYIWKMDCDDIQFIGWHNPTSLL